MPRKPKHALTAPSTSTLLTRLLEEPDLVRKVQGLEAPAFARLVRRVGIEDAGELFAIATGEQIARVVDEDLWVSDAPGEDENFDAERFALWLEVMLEAGEQGAARRIADLPEDLVALGLLQHVLVIDLDEWALRMEHEDEDEAELIEKALDSCLYCEIDPYRVISRGTNGWDAIVRVLLELDRKHHDVVERILSVCASASEQYIEEHDGLYEVLTAAETLEEDVRADRDTRRAREGYMAPADARAFLTLSKQTKTAEILHSNTPDPVTRAYFRELLSVPRKAVSQSHASAKGKRKASALDALLRDEESPRALPAQTPEADPFTRAMQALFARDVATHERVMGELVYLANVLLAGEGDGLRKLRPVEAAQAAAHLCALGLELARTELNAEVSDEAHASLIAKHGLVKLFQLAYQKVGLVYPT